MPNGRCAGPTARAAELRARGEPPDAAAGRRRGRLVRAVNDLQKLLAATPPSSRQTRQRVVRDQIPDGAHPARSACTTGNATPVATGRLGKPVEFGHKAQVTDNDDGIVLDHTVEVGNPADAPQLAPAVARVAQANRARARAPSPPTAATARNVVDDALHDLGVRTVAIPRKGKPPPRPGEPRETPASLPANNQVAHRL